MQKGESYYDKCTKFQNRCSELHSHVAVTLTSPEYIFRAVILLFTVMSGNVLIPTYML